MKNKETFPLVIEEQINSSGITELSKAQEIAVNYVPFLSEIDDQTKLLKELEKGNEQHVQKAHRIKLDLGKICSRAENQKRTDKQLILVQGKFIDGLFNVVNGAARLTQLEAKEIELNFEKIESERIEKVQIERANQLASFEMVAPPSLGEMEKDVFDNFLSGVKLGYQAKKEAERKAEEEKIQAQIVEKIRWTRAVIIAPYLDYFNDAEKIKLGELSESEFDIICSKLKEKKEAYYKKQKEIRLENERLKKEAAEREKKEHKQREKYEAEIRAEREEKELIELEEYNKRQKLEAELKVKKDAEAKAKAIEEILTELELKKGDSDKVNDLKSDLIALKSKYSFESKKNQKMYSDVGKMIENMIVHIDKYN